ncbi:unnamed protein product [Chironomus riparius]|uniref:Nudix hydrolase domain-containing protein n=1 Tax=Chironomus riparius TaxID=315576 RepID=A0A9N9WTZ9_9DIPT|nr:unnamed protein product [Chironomus riparius]
MNKIFKHIVCRNGIYANKIQRFIVDDERIQWNIDFDYKPPFYESEGLIGKPWADLASDDPNFKPQFNAIDGNVNRVSHTGDYKVVNNLPLNPFGRTGITGRGILGRYGPNHAADPIVSTWKRDRNNEIVKHEDGYPILRVLCIQRGDTKEIALPGGMVDPGEQVSVTLKREFIEEALNGKIQESELDDFFNKGDEVYKGYVDDPRNTDNAWMETVAVNFHDEDGTFLNKLKFEAGDDAIGIHWIEVSKDVKLYASHAKLIKATAALRKAHF